MMITLDGLFLSSHSLDNIFPQEGWTRKTLTKSIREAFTLDPYDEMSIWGLIGQILTDTIVELRRYVFIIKTHVSNKIISHPRTFWVNVVNQRRDHPRTSASLSQRIVNSLQRRDAHRFGFELPRLHLESLSWHRDVSQRRMYLRRIDLRYSGPSRAMFPQPANWNRSSIIMDSNFPDSRQRRYQVWHHLNRIVRYFVFVLFVYRRLFAIEPRFNLIEYPYVLHTRTCHNVS